MRLFVLTLGLAVAAFGQRGGGGFRGGGVPVGAGGGGGAMRAPGAAGAGFGSILFPGGAPGHAVINPGFGNTSFGSALGATVRGVPPGNLGGRRGGNYYGGGFGAGRAVIVPYPVYAAPAAAFGYGYAYDPMYAAPMPPVMMPSDQQQQQAPVVIINQHFKPDTVNPVVREYTSLPSPSGVAQDPNATVKVYESRTGPQQQASDEPTIFLIAMKEGSIMPALAFWVEGDTLHYITRESSHNRISLDRVDRDFSVKLNKERGLEFRLPQ